MNFTIAQLMQLDQTKSFAVVLKTIMKSSVELCTNQRTIKTKLLVFRLKILWKMIKSSTIITKFIYWILQVTLEAFFKVKMDLRKTKK